MPKPNIKDAPAATQAMLRRWLTDTGIETPNGVMPVRAAGILRWLQRVYSAGFDVLPGEVPQPAHDQLAEFKGSPAEQAYLRVGLGAELQLEQRAKMLAESMRKWANEPSNIEVAETARLEREKAAADGALEQRTAEIVNAAETERLEKLKAAARKQALKEIGHGQ